MNLFEDTYFTIEKPSQGLYKEKGSKFLAFAFPVQDETNIKDHLAQLRREHHSARHHCYAFRLGADKQQYRSNDDGEPSNSAGPPILRQIQSKDLTNVLVVVVRYFGGTLLGISGLVNAYKTAAEDALNQATIVEKTVNDVYKVSFDYAQMSEVMKIIKDENLEQVDQHFEMSCFIVFSVRKNKSNEVYDLIKKKHNLEIEFVKTI